MYDNDSISRLRQARIHSDSQGHNVTSVDFTPDGRLLVTSSEDDGLRLYDSLESGTLKQTLFAKKFGVSLVRFMHAPTTVVCASNCELGAGGGDHTLRYWSLHDNRYLRYFKGHKAKVVGIDVSPRKDIFMSSSEDGTVRMWDVRFEKGIGVLKLASGRRTNAAFDDEGKVFSVMRPNSISLYDAAMLTSSEEARAPFTTFHFEGIEKVGASSCMEWSSNGKYILLSGGSDTALLVDGFKGQIKARFRVSTPNTEITHASLTPDGRYCIAGTNKGSLHVWRRHSQSDSSVNNDKEVHVIHDKHIGSINVVKPSPCTEMVATACRNLHFWIPSLS